MTLEVENLFYRRGPQSVLSDISFEAKKGEVSVILGPNGAGKTTLLQCLNGILEPQKGRVRICGKEASGLTPRHVARHVAYMAQKNEAVHLTAFDAILMGRTPHMGFGPSREDLRKVDAVISHLGLEGLCLSPLTRMSGGELQRVCIARALAQETEVLLMDEPTSSLDLKNEIKILSLVRRIAQEHQVAVVITMHDINRALGFGHRLLFLKKGRLHRKAEPFEVTPEVIAEVYGVEVDFIYHNGLPVVVPAGEAHAA